MYNESNELSKKQLAIPMSSNKTGCFAGYDSDENIPINADNEVIPSAFRSAARKTASVRTEVLQQQEPLIDKLNFQADNEEHSEAQKVVSKDPVIDKPTERQPGKPDLAKGWV